MADAPAAVRTVVVAPERLQRWLHGFAERHGPSAYDVQPDVVRLDAPDGAWAECAVPFPPLDPAVGLVGHALAERRVGVLLVRRGGHAAGVFEGTRLVASKVGSRHVQGRTAAGGQSQQRFARRRENQARAAYAAAADVAAALLLPEVGALDALVLGGDRQAVREVLQDARLRALDTLAGDPWLTVPDPRRAVLDATAKQFRAVRIRVSDGSAGA